MESGSYRDGHGWEERAGYSRAVRRGSSIYVSGTTVSGRGVYVQTRDALRQAVSAVEELGGGIRDVVRTRIYLVPGTDWEEAASAHADVLGAVSPANTTLFVHSLVGEEFLVEIEMEAILAR